MVRVQLLASAWPIRLGIVRAQAVVAFAVRGAASAMPFLDSCCFFVAGVFLSDLLAVFIDSPRLGSGWIVRGARSHLPFLGLDF